jgi:hypothetical protein
MARLTGSAALALAGSAHCQSLIDIARVLDVQITVILVLIFGSRCVGIDDQPNRAMPTDARVPVVTRERLW